MPSNHAELLDRLIRQLGVLQSDRYANQLGEALRDQIIQRVPTATGNMAAKLLRIGPAKILGGRGEWKFSVSLGDQARLGNPDRAPRGTIRAFLKDYPQYRRRGKNSKSFQARQAWWLLSPAAKAKLQELRGSGLYGGGYQSIGSNKAAYFYQQEGSEPEWSASAEAAGITPTHFVRNSVDAWLGTDVPKIIRQFHADVENA